MKKGRAAEAVRPFFLHRAPAEVATSTGAMNAVRPRTEHPHRILARPLRSTGEVDPLDPTPGFSASGNPMTIPARAVARGLDASPRVISEVVTDTLVLGDSLEEKSSRRDDDDPKGGASVCDRWLTRGALILTILDKLKGLVPDTQRVEVKHA